MRNHYAELKAVLRPVQRTPGLWRINGCGTTMLGRYYDSQIAPKFYSLWFFTFLLIPIVPLGIFLVSSYGGNYSFYAEIRRKDFNAIYKHGYAKLLFNALGETALVFGVALAFLTVVFGLSLFFRR
jgi:hypothetical protein